MPTIFAPLVTHHSGDENVFESLLAPDAISDQPFFTIQGTKGEIVIHGFEGGCDLHQTCEDRPVKERICDRGWDAGYEGEYIDFVGAVLDGNPSDGTIDEAIKDLKVVIALFDASKNSEWVSI